ncbi:MAG: hypothetical protein ABII13_03195 [Patescibacteria group bacterium]|nr:cupredoxin domain-containing protein [Patescibacteria group bacterium]MBU2509329.1 cupredoxin domain-containing protein [Patescibacteria group bacterium]
MKYISSLISSLAAIAMLVTPLVTQASSTSFTTGDLIRGETINTVYYFGPDGKRYVFPNEKTYFTWYPDFSNVKIIADSELSAMPLGRSNVTYRPGYKMVKITTDPKVYAIDQGGILRWVKTAELAETLYGLNWKGRIDDIPDPFFVNYKLGTPIENSSQYNSQDTLTGTSNIAIDKQFDESHVTITIANSNQGFVPASTTVKKGSTVTWTNRDISVHAVSGDGFSSSMLQPEASFTHTFNTVGSFDYSCTVHEVQTGTVNVVN